VPPAKIFQSIGRPGSSGNREPGGIGFMSTQKRESRASATNSGRADLRGRQSHRTSPERARGRHLTGSSKAARFVGGFAGGLTASFISVFGQMWAWLLFVGNHKPLETSELATKFLHKDQPLRHCAQPHFAVELPGSPPSLQACGPRLREHSARQLAALGRPASPGHPAIPRPSEFATSPLTLPHAPVDPLRAERQDGKRDLYLLYAA
jgi:hypothetical protein